ncbi:MAG TPA: BatA domain-containing protein, partial [Pirellulales bacterium]|nr:BatA domain-containing protein [Pirellulales bacterium]
MGLLAPLYMAGLAALSLPLLLHLIRRTPRGRQAFSSLMFLTPSPPRLTRRSRLDHLLLLLLRLAILAILAFAFARPFLREAAVLPLDSLAKRRVAILLDTSASMRRGDLWQQAMAKVGTVLDDLGPKDDVAFFTFDDQWRALVGFVQDASEPTAGKPDLVRQRLKDLVPSWRSTDLAKALVGIAGELEAADEEPQLASQPQLVLITDLARGSRLDALEAYKWPDNVPVVVHALAAKRPTNATIRLLADDQSTEAAEPRVRVANAADSTGEEFFISWQGSSGKAAASDGGALATYVPAGQSRVIRLPRPPGEAAADRVVLKGDEAEFDNTYYVVPPVAHVITVDWIGDEP